MIYCPIFFSLSYKFKNRLLMLSLYYACSVPVMYAGTFTPRHKGIIQKKTISKIILISSSSSSKMVAINKATDTLSSQSSLSLRMTNSNTLASNDQTATIAAITPLPSVIKGRSDWREYRPFQLQNGIQCMLVHDKESKLTAMSVAVNVGASSDPRSMSGLAHFTEHMCFLGSAKYPGENEYKKYLSSHGGKSNASTSMSFTTFKFDVLAEHAEQAVDIFSQFFISPLFTKDGTTREVNAVDSENTRNIADDGRRRLQVLKALASPHHHFSKFSTGNKLTLAGVDIEGDENGSSHVGGFTKMRKAVIAFHRKHYKPENMVCVIVGPQTLDQLQEWIVPRFGVIETNVEKNASLENSITMDEDLQIEKLIDDAALDAPPTRYTDLLPPFNPAFSPQNQGVKWPIIVTMDPLKLQRKLVLLFPLPSVFKSPDTSPVAFISHLLGYEGAGSPFAVLQDAGLVNVISTGSRISAPDQCLFQVDISLTEKGEDQWKDVVQVIFQYIRLMEKTILDALTATTDTCHDLDAGTSKNNHESSYRSELHRIWDEIASIKSMNFNFTSPGNAYDFAPDLAQSIMSHGTKYCLTAGRTIADTAESRPSLPLHDIHSFVALMAPENCIIERFSKRAWEESNAVHSSSIHESTNGDLGSPFGVKQEKWYGVNYIVSSVDVDDISRWKTNRIRLRNDLTGTQENTKSSEASIMEMHLPKPNQFIPRSLELSHELPEEARVGPRIEKEMDPPDLISPYDDTKRLWHKLDDRYALPKSSFVLLLRNPYLEHSYDKTLGTWRYDEHFDLCSSLLLNMFSDGLSQATYDASLAGLSWSASKSSSGLSIACLGYSDRLPELALLLIQSFCGKIDGVDKGSVFLTENLFLAAKDRVTRSLQSYFQSGRADSHAFYYRDFILSGRGRGIDHKLELLSKITLSDIVQQRNRVLLYPGTEFDCLSTGNVPRGEAKDLFQKVCDILDSVSPSFNYEGFPGPMRWIPGPVARKLPSGDDVEIHFSSKNPEEQSGAVVMTFQSSRSGFKGPFLSPKNALKETAAVRLISHIMREPFFNELRTKQQLGYVVHSSYELAFSSAWLDTNSQYDEASTMMLSMREITPFDSIVMSILSKNTNPLDVASRIDKFLTEFRDTLETMPISEIKDHATSISKQMRKPIQKLGDEVSLQFSKITLYAPETLSKGGSPKDMPWKSSQILSDEIVNLNRLDLLETWDRLVTSKQRSRVTSFVYGTSFPLAPTSRRLFSKKAAHFSLDELLQKRLSISSAPGSINRFRVTDFRRGMIGLTALALIGASIFKFATARADDRKQSKPENMM